MVAAYYSCGVHRTAEILHPRLPMFHQKRRFHRIRSCQYSAQTLQLSIPLSINVAIKNGIRTSKNTSKTINTAVKIDGFLYSLIDLANFFIINITPIKYILFKIRHKL
mgnify:CR=1 FL=1